MLFISLELSRATVFSSKKKKNKRKEGERGREKRIHIGTQGNVPRTVFSIRDPANTSEEGEGYTLDREVDLFVG